MLIWRDSPEGVRYYKWVNDGRVIWGPKATAADLFEPSLSAVLRHLAILDPNGTHYTIERSASVREAKKKVSL